MPPQEHHRSDTVHRALRDGTRDAHRALHALAPFAALLAGRLTRDDYAALTARLHEFYRSFDARVDAAWALCLAPRPCAYSPRAPLLAADPAALGHAARAAAATPALPAFDEAARLAGALYVVEGSLLGGATLDGGAQRVLGTQDEAGRGYWAWCRREVGRRCPAMLALLDEVLDTPRALDAAQTTARATFAALHDWLAPTAHAQC